MPKIAYQGYPNNYSSLALKELSKKYKFDAESQSFATYEELFKSSSDFAFFAIQNNSYSLNDLFSKISEYKWNVVAEYYWSTPLDLVGSGSFKDVKYIVAVDHILSICKKFFANSKYQVISVDDTAEACRFVSEKNSFEYAAIAPKFTANQFSLKSIKEKIEDDSALTRFYLVSKDSSSSSVSKLFSSSNSSKNSSSVSSSSYSENPFKSSLMIKLTNQSGSLHRAIGCFSTRNINISQIESFSSSRSKSAFSPWDHYFLLDVEGDYKDSNVSNAIENLKEFANEVVVLGSYPSLVQERAVSPVGN